MNSPEKPFHLHRDLLSDEYPNLPVNQTLDNQQVNVSTSEVSQEDMLDVLHSAE
ncbi:MAG: hypothetical protein NZ551_09990 [Microscillaceae bacterium]|nr:hypothetical protein [Microscillaceae bacterium]MDW8461526.1 hypothetical protein [Cytophagales bacterium]